MSLINQPIVRKGLFIKPISNYVTTSGVNIIEQVLPLGLNTANQQSFASFDGSKIVINETAKYRITYNFFSRGTIGITFGSYAQFGLRAGSQIIGLFSGFANGNTIETNDFGLANFYRYPDTNITNSFFSITLAASSFSWSGYLNKTVELNLISGDSVRLYISGTNLNTGSHTAGFDGYFFVEQVS